MCAGKFFKRKKKVNLQSYNNSKCNKLQVCNDVSAASDRQGERKQTENKKSEKIRKIRNQSSTMRVEKLALGERC